MSIVTNENRIGNFSSSRIAALTNYGSRKMTEEEQKEFIKNNPKSKKTNTECWPSDAGLTYIKETNLERRLGRALNNDTSAKATNWGHANEPRAFDILGLDYSYNSAETIVHPEFDFWCGSPDGFKYDEGKTVIDFKSPYTLGSFCELVQPIYDGLTGMDAINALRLNHKDGEKYFQQLVSNACVSQSKYAELIIYVPYEDELDEIMIAAYHSEDKRFSFIGYAEKPELPYLIKGGYYQNLNKIRFEVPQEEKDTLTEKVKKAGEFLIERQQFATQKQPQL